MPDEYAKLPPGEVVQPCSRVDAKKFWIEVELIGEDGTPVSWEEYRVRLPDGTLASGLLDQDGWTRIDGIPAAGACQICFPKLDQGAWQFIESKPERQKKLSA
jgi:hypothetical protein